VFVFNFGGETSNKETFEFLGLDENKPVYTMFTNVLWDAASAQREIAFSNPVEWVLETIRWFNEASRKATYCEDSSCRDDHRYQHAVL
jgi:hypothetical protein